MNNCEHKKVDHFPIGIITSAKEEETLTALIDEVEVHLNNIF